jgi:hypothetical protein
VSKLYRRPNMAENTIEIEVELKGGKTVEESLEALKSGSKDVGEGFKGLTSVMDKSSAQIGEGLSTMSEAVGDSIDAFGELKGSVDQLGKGGVSSFMGLIGPIGMVTGAVAALYEGYMQLSGAAELATHRQEAMAAASADLFSKLEMLAEGGVIPTTTALMNFTKITLQSQLAKELLEKQVEKLRPQMERLSETMDDTAKAQAELNKATAKGNRTSEEALAARRRLNVAELEEIKAKAELQKKLAKLQGPLQENLKLIAASAKQEKELEKATTDNLKAKVKENAERLKVLLVAEQELYTKDALVLANAKEQIELEAANLVRKTEDMSRKDLIKTIKEQGQAILEFNQQRTEGRAQAARQRRAFEEADAKAAEAEKKRLEGLANLRAKMAQAEATRRAQQQSMLRQLDIKLTKEGDDELLALARERYETGLELAKEDAMARAIVLKQYQLETQTIMDQAEAREMARLERQDEAHRKIQAEAAARREKTLQKELANQKMLMDQVGAVIDMYGKGLAEAGVAALMFGEGFKKVAGEVLKGLAIESAVRALMEGAKALAALFVNPAAAAAHAKSAGLYTAAAAAARAGAGALGVGGSGTAAGGGTTASPSGAPQEAGAPQRERAETRETVVNINFGGAVIYDSQEAARRAMMNELVRTYNSAPRGSARFNMGR